MIPNTVELIYAGGTFGSYGSPLTALSAERFLPPFLQQYPNISPLENASIKDSSEFNSGDFFALYQVIKEAFDIGKRQFILITGTDTLSYLAGFLHYALAGFKLSLVITGSMLPFFQPTTHPLTPAPDSDASSNFNHALSFLQQNHYGVFVSFYHSIYTGNSVQKLHTHAPNAFDGKPFDQQLRTLSPPATVALPHLPSTDIAIYNVYCLPNQAAELNRSLLALLEYTPTAVLIIGFGAGNSPHSAALEQTMRRLDALGFLLIIASACPFGGVSSDYASGAWQYHAGAVSGANLTLPALYGKALWLCATTPINQRKALWNAL